MRYPLPTRSLACLLLALAAPAALADVVYLANGDRLTGAITSVAGGRVRIETEYSNAVIVDLESVRWLETTEPLSVTTGDKDRIQGSLGVRDDQQVLQAGDDVIVIEPAQIRRAAHDRMSLTSLAADLSSRLDFSTVVSSGNTDTEAINLLFESTLTRERSEHGLTALVAKEKTDGEDVKDQMDINYGYKRYLNERWYAAGNAQYFEDQIKDVDYRITVGAGIGYQFWKNTFGELSTEVGASVVAEELDGDGEQNPAFRWALDYRRLFWNEQLEFFHRNSVLAIAASGRGEIIQSSTGLRFGLNEMIDATARVDLVHETEPAPGKHKSDVTYSVGVGVKF